MDISISENLKRLRLNKRITQEELANFLGVSIQAISKWERNEDCPDISLLPKIASYYNITVDDLLGVGEIKKKERIKQILDEYARNSQDGNIDANIKLMREAVKEFPNEYLLIGCLMQALFVPLKGSDEIIDKNVNEIIKLGEKIISGCTLDYIRYSALQILCLTYSKTGNYDKAKEYANKLPVLPCTSNVLLKFVLKDEELLEHTQRNLMYLADEFYMNIVWMLKAKKFTDEEKIHAYKTVIKFVELIFEDGDFGFWHCRLTAVYLDIAKLYANLNNFDMTLENLALSAKHSIITDTIKEHPLTSPLVNGLKFTWKGTSKNFQGSQSKETVKEISDKCFDFCRSDERFKKIESDLKRYI